MPHNNSIVHQLINKERIKRGLPRVRWSQQMYYLAKDQANYCARIGHLVHSSRYALQGGENLCGGRGNMSPKAIVSCWMHSKAGHRDWLLDPRVKLVGVGISKSKHGTYAAWAFSGDTGELRDIPLPNPIEVISRIGKWLSRPKLLLKGRRQGMLRTPVTIFFGFLGALGIALGAHGVYVYFSRLELLLGGGEASKLFLAIEVPIRLRSAIIWMSYKGVQGWVIPTVILVVGFVVWNKSGIWDLATRTLERLRLW